MSGDQFDVIIVGGGIAGLSAGYQLAQEGISTLILERGSEIGRKNCSGGRLYTSALHTLLGPIAQGAPLERQITREKLSSMRDNSALTLDFQPAAPTISHSLLRARFDPWLAQQAEQAGAEIITGIRVDRLLQQGKQICGVVSGEDAIQAKVVILAEGVNSLLAQSVQLTSPPQPDCVALGVKQVIALPDTELEARFGLTPEQGIAWLFTGFPSAYQPGGGFIYTNRGSVSLGVVTRLDAALPTQRLLSRFRAHPIIAPLIEGGEVMEYSAHLVPEGGYDRLSTLYRDGVLMVGDAAGFCLNRGFTLHGMDLAILSGLAAAQAVCQALVRGDVSRQGLACYRDFLMLQGVLQAMRQYRHLPRFLAKASLYREYPEAIEAGMEAMYSDGFPLSMPLRRRWLAALQGIGVGRLLRDVIGGIRAL